MPFSDLVRDFAAQGLSRRQAAEAMSIHYNHFTRILHRDGDPFASPSVAKAYLERTGENMNDAIMRLAQTHTLAAAARVLGYRNNSGLGKYLKAQGIEVQFKTYGVRPGQASISELARRSGVRYGTIRERLLAGMSDDEATSAQHQRLRNRQVSVRPAWMRRA